MIRFTGHDLTLSTKLTRKRNHIVVDDKNFELIKSYGNAGDTMNDAVTMILEKVLADPTLGRGGISAETKQSIQEGSDSAGG